VLQRKERVILECRGRRRAPSAEEKIFKRVFLKEKIHVSSQKKRRKGGGMVGSFGEKPKKASARVFISL